MQLTIEARIDSRFVEEIVLDVRETDLRCVCRTVTRRGHTLAGSGIQTWRGQIITAYVSIDTRPDQQGVVTVARLDCAACEPSTLEDIRLSINGVLSGAKEQLRFANRHPATVWCKRCGTNSAVTSDPRICPLCGDTSMYDLVVSDWFATS